MGELDLCATRETPVESVLPWPPTLLGKYLPRLIPDGTAARDLCRESAEDDSCEPWVVDVADCLEAEAKGFTSAGGTAIDYDVSG